MEIGWDIYMCIYIYICNHQLDTYRKKSSTSWCNLGKHHGFIIGTSVTLFGLFVCVFLKLANPKSSNLLVGCDAEKRGEKGSLRHFTVGVCSFRAHRILNQFCAWPKLQEPKLMDQQNAKVSLDMWVINSN